MHIAFSGSLNEKQLKMAIGKHSSGVRIIAIAFIVIGVLALISGIVSPNNSSNSFDPFYGIMLAVLGLVLLALPWFSSRRQYRTSKMIGSPVEGLATDKLLAVKSCFGHAEVPWNTFHKYAATKDMILLYQSAYLFHVIPKSFFQNDAEWSEFEQFVRNNIKQK